LRKPGTTYLICKRLRRNLMIEILNNKQTT